MRTRAALLVVGAAAALGTLAGAFVLPDRGLADGSGPHPTMAVPATALPSPSASPSPSAPPSPSGAKSGSTDPVPVDSVNMLSTGDFDDVGLTVVSRTSDARLELVTCTKHETLDNIASSGPPVQRTWEKGSIVAYQQAIAARDDEEAVTVTKRVLRKLEACQQRPPPYWIYGPTHTKRLGPATTASWLGEVDGTLNTSGTAPAGEKIHGGIAVLRNGSHVSVFVIEWCASAGDGGACTVAPHSAYQQLAALSRAAALRLG